MTVDGSKLPRLVRERVRDFRLGSWRQARGTFLVQTGSKHAYYLFEAQGGHPIRAAKRRALMHICTSPSVRQRSKLNALGARPDPFNAFGAGGEASVL